MLDFCSVTFKGSISVLKQDLFKSIFICSRITENWHYLYHIIKPTLMHDLLNTVSVEVVKNISEIVEIVSQCTDYDPEYHKMLLMIY